MKTEISYKDSMGEYLYITSSEKGIQIEVTNCGHFGSVIFTKEEMFKIAKKLIELSSPSEKK